MILEMTYSDGHHECFDSNSLTWRPCSTSSSFSSASDSIWPNVPYSGGLPLRINSAMVFRARTAWL